MPKPTLTPGSRGTDVRRLQLLLNSKLKPSPRLKIDGSWRSLTGAAVNHFQQIQGLSESGLVGDETWRALGQFLTPVASSECRSDPSAPWMEIACAEQGVYEYANPGEHNPRILEYFDSTWRHPGNDEEAWCAAFVNWVLVQAGYRGANSPRASRWLQWGIELAQPRYGAITVLQQRQAAGRAADSGFHVAFYCSTSPTHIRLLGGNQSGPDPEHPGTEVGFVRTKDFVLDLWEVKGYRWPR